MKKYCFILIFVIILIPLYSQDDFEIRGFKWDTTSDVIIQREGEPDNIANPFNRPGLEHFYYNSVFVAGYYMSLEYVFFDNKLVNVYYETTEYGNYLDKYRNIYMDLLEKLIDIYEEPDIIWNNLFDVRNPFNIRMHPFNRNYLTPSEVVQGINDSYDRIEIELEYSNHGDIGFANESSWDIDGTEINLSLRYFVVDNTWRIFLGYTSPKQREYLNQLGERERQSQRSTEGL